MDPITVTGTRLGRPAILQWDAGKLTGDAFLILDAQDAVAAGRLIDVPGVIAGDASLDEAAGNLLIAATMADVFDTVTTITGADVAEAPRGSSQ